MSFDLLNGLRFWPTQILLRWFPKSALLRHTWHYSIALTLLLWSCIFACDSHNYPKCNDQFCWKTKGLWNCQLTYLPDITLLLLLLLLLLWSSLHVTLIIIQNIMTSSAEELRDYEIVNWRICFISFWLQLVGPKWNFGKVLYRIWLSNDILCGVASIINLAAISLERYICITFPLSYHTRMTHTKALILIVAIWIFAFIMASVKFFFHEWERPNYELLVTISCFFLPLVIICNSYRLIFKTARYQARQIAMMVNGGVKNFLLASEVRAAKTLGVVMGAFVICWSPFFLLNLVYGVCLSCYIPDEAIMATKWMHYCNSVFNPIVYACMNKEFRGAFWSILMNGKACVSKMRRGSSCEQSELTERTFNNMRSVNDLCENEM